MGPQPIGTGGGLRYRTEEPDPNMVNQELPHSCQAACARQLLKDAGIDVTEMELLDRIGYMEGFGTTAELTAKALDELHPIFGYDGGGIGDQDFDTIFARDPWIASLLTDQEVVHAVIVDRKTGELVEVRDPWGLSGPDSGSGTRATIQLNDFMKHWRGAFNHAVFPNRQKTRSAE